jgi:cytochrome P460
MPLSPACTAPPHSDSKKEERGMSAMSMIARAAAGVVAAGALGFHLSARVQAGDADATYPQGYRNWAHVKSTLVGPQSPAFAVNGGLHHYYANEKGLEGYRTGTFPDGAVLVDDLLETKETAGVTSEGPRRRLAVMVKASQKYPDTGGWGFEVFRGDTSDPSSTAELRQACFKCHTNAGPSRVFSQFRK